VDRLTDALRTAPLTMSFGVATFPGDGDDSQALLKAADQRLYRSKGERKPDRPSAPQSAECQCEHGPGGLTPALPLQRQAADRLPE
jgi:hypothetical protein